MPPENDSPEPPGLIPRLHILAGKLEARLSVEPAIEKLVAALQSALEAGADKPLAIRLSKVAARLDVSPDTLHRWIQAGHFGPAVRLISGCKLVDAQELECWVRTGMLPRLQFQALLEQECRLARRRGRVGG